MDGGITPSELQAELDTLRSLRRRSVSQPSDGIDPDLPPSPSKYSSSGSPPTSPTSSFSPLASTSSSPYSSDDAPVAGPSRFPGGTPTTPDLDYEARDDLPLGDPNGGFGAGSISDLFWLPARLHPEIAPQEFRNFIRDQTNPENLMRRSGSMLGRKKSTLSKQYIPSESDSDSGHGSSTSVSRTPSRAGSFRRNTGLERLTLNDLQRLETLARQSAEEGQQGEESGAQFKRLVRRSLSLNPAALLSAADQLGDDDTQLIGDDETDSPLIVPPPGSILRRSARTKIRKNSLLGDGGGHRFGPSKRTPRSPYGGTVSENGEDDFEGNRRTVSVGSVGSLESGEDQQGDQSARTLTPEPQHSPDKSDYMAPIPPQYMSPMLSDPSTSRNAVQAASRNLQDQVTVTSARAGADMPTRSNASPSPPRQQTSLPQTSAIPLRTRSPEDTPKTVEQARQEAAEKLTASMVGSGSVMASRRPGDQPLRQASPVQLEQSPTIRPDALQEAKPMPPSKTFDDRMANSENRREHWQQEVVSPPPPNITPTYTITPPQAQQAYPAPSAPHDPRKQQYNAPGPVSVAPASRTASPQQTLPIPPPAKEHKEKKSKWAKLGLSRSNKEDSSDFDDAASTMSASSASSGGFSIAGGGKKGKKGKKDKPEPVVEARKVSSQTGQAPIEKEKEKEKAEGGGFFGGLFGGKKKSDSADHEKKETQSAHLQLPTPPPTASGMLTADGTYVNFYRLPIHIERAVYRLSHIKLANPRRPLFEQVLISNLMFWYLGVINKPAVPPSQMQQQQQHMRHGQQTQDRSQHPQQPMSPAGPPPQRPQMQREKSDPSLGQESMPPHSQAPIMPSSPHGGFAVQESAPSSAYQRPQSHPPSSPPKQGHEDEARPAGQVLRTSAPISTQYAQSGSPPALEHTMYPITRSSDQTSPISASISTADLPHQTRQWPQRGASMTITNATQQSIPLSGSARRSASDDVHYDARRNTADLDTYDIISAYADEERRKSLLAQEASSTSEAAAAFMPRKLSNGTRSLSPQQRQDPSLQLDQSGRPVRSPARDAASSPASPPPNPMQAIPPSMATSPYSGRAHLQPSRSKSP